MGSYSHLTIADYPTFSAKNSYYQEIINLIFLPEDFINEKRKNFTRNKLVWGDTYKDDKGTYTFIGYRQTAKVCKQRLEIFGMNLKRAKNDFPFAKKIAQEEYIYDFPISKVSFRKYLREISDIVDKKEINYEQLYINLRESLITGELGIFGQSIQAKLYSILSIVPENAIVEYDFTDVINGGWVKEKEAKRINTEKILVLTEGKTDVEFISASLKKLYPYLYPYYHFIDFDEYKVESNASALVKLVTSLAASNIKHPIIVLFDNDTTGIMEMKKLRFVQMGDNFKILKLPDLQLAKRYPTIGPTGIKKMNVNGLACGIEMFLGKDTLTKNENLIPVHWKAYNEKEKKYQGEISEKDYVQNRYREILKSELNHDFTDMDLLLRQIFKAFSYSPKKIF